MRLLDRTQTDAELSYDRLIALAAQVDADKATAADLGVQATPTFFINGRRIAGNRPVADLRAVIELALAES